MKKRLSKFIKRSTNLLMLLSIVAGQLLFPFAVAQPQTVHAAPVCVIDTAGANDEPGQKDLTKLCVDYDNVPTTVATTWNWDDLGTSGNNTMDACNLFDTDGDGNINYSVCVTTEDTPATFQTLTTYSCGDDKIDRCTSPATIVSSGSTSCAVSQQPTDPFPAGTASPTDTQGSCTIQLSTVGGVAAKLVDVCSYPSGQPNSDPSDCVIAREDFGKVELIKQLEPDTDPGLFNLTIDGPDANDTTTVNNVGDGGTTGEVVVKKGSVVVSETAGTNTTLAGYNTTIVCRDLNGTGAIVGQGTPTDPSSRQLTFTLVEDADVVCVITNDRQQATLTLVKTVINDDGGTLTQANFPVFISGDSAQWGSNSVNPGSYTISETSQFGYTPSVWGGDCDAQGNVALTDGQSKTCTITNDDIAPQLTVIKHVINDNGGTAVAGDFTMAVTGTDVSDPSFPGVESPGTTVTLDAGSYSVGETGPSGYAASFSADCSGTVSVGQTKTCTVTNDDVAPSLTLIKNVTNDNGGTALPTNWTLTGTPSDSQYQTISGSGTASGPAQANVSYALAETGPGGYAASSWNCDGGDLVGTDITLAPGDTVTCTITNNDIPPRLTVTKLVVNDDGGTLQVTDFPLFVNSIQVTSGVEYTSFNAGSYTVSETQADGYDFVSILGDCGFDGSITLEVGGVYNCTLTNDDIPARITVNKIIVNDDGGTAEIDDFDLFVGGTEVTHGANNTFDANQSYTVSEQSLVDGYTQTSLVCLDSATGANLGATFTPALAQTIVCTITNDDVAPTLTLVKNVINDDGGQATAANFQASISGDPVAWSTPVGLTAGSYTASETVLAGGEGYTASAWTGDCGSNGTIALSLGENAVCYITNDDQPATLVLIKNLPNDNGGDATQDDFAVYIDNDQVDWGVNSVNAGSHTVREDTLPGYTPSSWNQDCDANGNVSLIPGEVKVCDITNDDVAPQITVVKEVVSTNLDDFATDFSFNLDEGTNDFSLDDDASDPTLDNQTTLTVDAGNHSVTENLPSGWKLTNVDCGRADDVTLSADGFSVDLEPGDQVTCTFTNTRLGSITIVKDAQPDSPQEFTFTGNLTGDNEPNFVLIDDGVTPALASRNFDDLEDDTYTVTEPTVQGWKLTSITCEGGSDTDTHERNAVIKLQPGEHVTCTFVNERETGTITVHKITDPDQATDAFTINLRQDETIVHTSSLMGGQSETYTVPTDSYSLVEEDIPDGWSLVSATCVRGDQAPFDPRNVFELSADETLDCTFVNERPQLVLVKANDAEGEDKLVGDVVTYSLQAQVPEEGGALADAAVIDLPPENFNYQPGSWTAVSSVRGDLKADNTTPEPIYASPGQWFLGNLIPGEIITLTYRVVINSLTTPGTYPDIAFASGTAGSGATVLSNVHFASSPFVGTQVDVVELAAASRFQALGLTLPNTASGWSWLPAILPPLLIGGWFFVHERRRMQNGVQS